MSIFVIEFNDAAISASRDGELLLESPGYAVLDGQQLYLGNEARDIARIRPRWTNYRFWSALGTEPMAGATAQVRHHADLAYAHLKSIWNQIGEEGSEAIFAVPGHWSKEQLGLLLGIADEVGLKVRCMVDAAVAASAAHDQQDARFHLDISLHRIVLSELAGNETLERNRLFVVAEEGLVHFNNLWANTIADQFVHATRFDPMHRAEIEQQLHDRLPTCLAELDDLGAAIVELDDAGKHYSVTVRRDQLVSAAASTYPRIVQQLQIGTGAFNGEGALLLAERFSGFPGLHEALAVIPGINVHALAPGAAARGCMANLDALQGDDDQVQFHTAIRRGPKAVGGRKTEAKKPLPTHLLYRGQAWALGGQPMVLSMDESGVLPGEDIGAPQCSVQRLGGRIWLEPRPVTRLELNGREVDDKVALSVGDSLRFDGHEEAVQVISLSS
ncbi:MAG: hypothetical protein HKN59_02795 [Gammaproteobacteria bacterium]|nr:hypothetical protein [Gammaproteobacteria bacterium]